MYLVSLNYNINLTQTTVIKVSKRWWYREHGVHQTQWEDY